MAHIQFCFAIFVSAAVTLTFAGNQEHVNIVKEQAVMHQSPHGAMSLRNRRELYRIKRNIQLEERDAANFTFNDLRAKVGSSDMTYVTYSIAYETLAREWTLKCNFDDPIQPIDENPNFYAIKKVSQQHPDFNSWIQEIFNNPQHQNAVRSIYVTRFGAEYSLCSTLRINGATQSNVYLSLYLLVYTSCFNKDFRQYSPGTSCSYCENGATCYNNLLCKGREPPCKSFGGSLPPSSSSVSSTSTSSTTSTTRTASSASTTTSSTPRPSFTSSTSTTLRPTSSTSRSALIPVGTSFPNTFPTEATGTFNDTSVLPSDRASSGTTIGGSFMLVVVTILAKSLGLCSEICIHFL